MVEPWTWEGEVEGRRVLVEVHPSGRNTVRALDGGDGCVSPSVHISALSEALRAAVARMRALEAAGAAMVAQVERLREGLAQAGFEVGDGN